ncbi:MAG: hypothetical protein LUG56_05215 [Lachnospiraceae bacterium]|nr:hypothetical protein [Lachnospiraceae bacterium]
MRLSELLRLVWLNINQNRFKTVMTSIGIIVGAATIVMVIAIGRGGQMDVAEQFASLNAGSIDITYDYAGEETSAGGDSSFSFSDFGSSIMSNISNLFGGGNSGGRGSMDSGSSSSSADTSSGNSASGGRDMAMGGGMTMGGDFSADASGDSDASGNSSGGRGNMGNFSDFSDSDISDMAEAFASGEMDMSDIEEMFSGEADGSGEEETEDADAADDSYASGEAAE